LKYPGNKIGILILGFWNLDFGIWNLGFGIWILAVTFIFLLISFVLVFVKKEVKKEVMCPFSSSRSGLAAQGEKRE
jgi:hypothetical protein